MLQLSPIHLEDISLTYSFQRPKWQFSFQGPSRLLHMACQAGRKREDNVNLLCRHLLAAWNLPKRYCSNIPRWISSRGDGSNYFHICNGSSYWKCGLRCNGINIIHRTLCFGEDVEYIGSCYSRQDSLECCNFILEFSSQSNGSRASDVCTRAVRW